MIVKERMQIGPDGEIMSGEQIVIRKIEAETYCQLYIKDNKILCSLSQAEYRVLCACIGRSTYYDDEYSKAPGNEIIVNTKFHEFAKEQCGVVPGTVRNTIVRLVQKKLLIKDSGCRGVYYLNPKYFFCGKVSIRASLIKKVELWTSDPEKLKEQFENGTYEEDGINND